MLVDQMTVNEMTGHCRPNVCRTNVFGQKLWLHKEKVWDIFKMLPNIFVEIYPWANFIKLFMAVLYERAK
jgi:hypothetical protein